MHERLPPPGSPPKADNHSTAHRRIDPEDANQSLESGEEEHEMNDTEEPNEEKDRFLVGWDGDDDPANPRNFSNIAKCFIVSQVRTPARTFRGS
jgi:uncharacterized protein YcnI